MLFDKSQCAKAGGAGARSRITMATEHQHASGGAELTDQRQAVFASQVDVKHHHLGPQLRGQPQGVGHAGGSDDAAQPKWRAAAPSRGRKPAPASAPGAARNKSSERPQRAYHVEVPKSVEKAISKLPEALAERIERRIDALAQDPRPHGAEKIKGEANTYRVRDGDYRILYEIHDRVLRVLVLTVGNRREVYRKR